MSDGNRKPWIFVALLAVIALIGVGVWWAQRDDGEADPDAQAADADPAPREQSERERASESRRVAPARVSVGGRVTRADDGSGIAGAVVLLARKDLVQGQAPAPGQATAPLTAITDANGGWQLAAVDPGRYTITATAVGFIPGLDDDVRVAVGPDQPPINLSLRAGGAVLSGTITDIGGGPVEGALVRVGERGGPNLGFNQIAFAAISDEDGRYRVQLAPGRYTLSTLHPDYVAEVRATDLPEAGRREDFRLVPGGTIEGVVLARPDGTPVANARVTFSDSRRGDFAGAGFNTNVSLDGSVVMTDDEGRFRLTGLRAGVVSLMARAPAHASVAAEEVPIGIGEQVSGVEVWVDRAYSISGFVVAKGEPERALEGVLVGAWQLRPFGLLVASAPSASDGYFEIIGVTPGEWQVGAVSEDHLVSITGARASVVDQDVDDLVVELERGVYVRGRVDPGVRAQISLAIDGDDVSLLSIARTIGDALASATADETGAFELGPISPGTFSARPLKLVAQTDEGFRGEASVELGRDDVDGVVITMERGASVLGLVLDEAGVPQRGVTVSITPVEGKRGGGVINFAGRGDGAPTGDDGRFAARGLELGPHEVLIKDSKGRPLSWAPGSGPAQTDAQVGADEVPPLVIDIEDAVTEQFLDLRVVPRDAEISGVVLDAEGLPVADAWVRASVAVDDRQVVRRPGRDGQERKTGVVPEPEGATRRSWTRSTWFAEPPVLTDENGLFVIKQLRRDRNYHLVAEGERGGARATLEDVAPRSRVTLTLEQLSGIDGVVTLDGAPVTDYQVRLIGPSSRDKRVVHPKGEFRIDRLDPGEYEVQISAEVGTGEAEVELGEAGRAAVRVELERAGSLRGQVVGGDGEPLAGLRIMVISEGAGFDPASGLGLLTGQGPTTDRDGRFEIANVAPGKGTIGFLDPDAGVGSASVAEREFELEPGDELDLGTIEGVVAEAIPKDERGTLQLRTRAATWARRPRPPGTDLDAEPPDPERDADPRDRLWVYSVDVGGVADEAGVAPGDEILAIDGQTVAAMGPSMAAELLSNARLRVEQAVRLELERDGDRFDVTLKAAPARGPSRRGPG